MGTGRWHLRHHLIFLPLPQQNERKCVCGLRSNKKKTIIRRWRKVRRTGYRKQWKTDVEVVGIYRQTIRTYLLILNPHNTTFLFSQEQWMEKGEGLGWVLHVLLMFRLKYQQMWDHPELTYPAFNTLRSFPDILFICKLYNYNPTCKKLRSISFRVMWSVGGCPRSLLVKDSCGLRTSCLSTAEKLRW